MNEPLPEEEGPPQRRIAFSVTYLVTVIGMGVLNAVFFVILAGRVQDMSFPFESLSMLAVFFGILYAGACSLSALSLARWLRRKENTDRILLFLLIEFVGLTLLALGMPYLVRSFL